MAKSKVKAVKPSEKSCFDKESVYRSVIKPLVDELVNTCTIHDIPVFVTVCTANDSTSSTYHYDGMSPEGLNMELSNDFFGKMLCVAKGFDTVPPANNTPDDIDESDSSLKRISAERFEEEDQ